MRSVLSWCENQTIVQVKKKPHWRPFFFPLNNTDAKIFNKILTNWIWYCAVLFYVCMCVCVFSHVWLFGTPWTVACQVSLSMEFSRQKYWSGLPFPTPGNLPDPVIKSMFPALQADSLPLTPSGRPISYTDQCSFSSILLTSLSLSLYFFEFYFWLCCI